jgi:hypothetical protein
MVEFFKLCCWPRCVAVHIQHEWTSSQPILVYSCACVQAAVLLKLLFVFQPRCSFAVVSKWRDVQRGGSNSCYAFRMVCWGWGQHMSLRTVLAAATAATPSGWRLPFFAPVAWFFHILSLSLGSFMLATLETQPCAVVRCVLQRCACIGLAVCSAEL